jgi:hypothetical protein
MNTLVISRIIIGWIVAISIFIGCTITKEGTVDKFYRIGMGGFIHFSKYKYNMVQNFCGPKILDLVIRPKQVFKNKKS